MTTSTMEPIALDALDTVTGGRGQILTSILGPDATTAWNEYYQSGGTKRSYGSAQKAMNKPFSWF